jgi:hypothetical protein
MKESQLNESQVLVAYPSSSGKYLTYGERQFPGPSGAAS